MKPKPNSNYLLQMGAGASETLSSYGRRSSRGSLAPLFMAMAPFGLDVLHR
jgi:hypothetical protein